VAFSISDEREELLKRGLGLEHLTELAIRLARPIILDGRSVAYAGGWRPSEDNFTYVFLRLISAEQDDTADTIEAPEESSSEPRQIAPLINHLAWPHYLEVSPRVEAEWINSCRIVRVRQEDAGLSDLCPDAEAPFESDRAVLNAAVTLSEMRRRQTMGMEIPGVGDQRPEHLPMLAARIVIGGRITGSSAFGPGAFEESLLALENNIPLYVLGGFGGAAGILVEAFLSPGTAAQAFDAERIQRETPGLARRNAVALRSPLPSQVRTTPALMAALLGRVAASSSLAATFNTGLEEAETRDLMTTTDIDTAVRLVMKGLKNRLPTT
jgi:hypothetical protein